MRTTYRVLAWILAVEVVVQAAVIAWALFGLTTWIFEGGVLDAAAIESESTQFDGVVGFMVHGMNGTIIVPVVALLLLIVSFFAKLPRGVTYAAALFGMVVAQVALGIFAHSVPSMGMLHGALALGILIVAVLSARLTATPRAADREQSAALA